MSEFSRTELVTHFAMSKLEESFGEGVEVDLYEHDGDSTDLRGVIDESQPTVMMYDRNLVESGELLSSAAARLRARGEQVANFVISTCGIYAETLVEDEAGSRLMLASGYALDKKRRVHVFERPDNPIPIAMADISMPTSVTFQHLDRAGIAMLRPKEVFEYGDKWLAKQRMQEFGISTPSARVYSFDELASVKHELPERFVIKPRDGMCGTDVTIFADGMDEARFSDAIEAMRKYYPDVMVEEYLESMSLKFKDVEGAASFNIRAVIYNGYCGGFARVHEKDKPGNTSGGGAMAVSIPKLKRALRSRHPIKVKGFDAKLETIADQISGAFPDTFIGADIMFDQSGEPHVIELNFADFGAYDVKACSTRDINRSLENTVRNISAVASTIQLPPAPVELSTTRSIYDYSELALSNIIKRYLEEPRYYVEGSGFQRELYVKENRGLLLSASRAFEERRCAGDQQHTVTTFEAIQEITREGADPEIYDMVTASLSKIALASRD